MKKILALALILFSGVANAGIPNTFATMPAGNVAASTLDANFTYVNNISANVISSGAKGDCATDDTAAIQSALNSGAGGTVVFPTPNGGCYKVTGLTIPPSSNTEIVGNNSVLQLTAANGVMFTIGDGTAHSVNINFHGFILNGEGKSNSTGFLITNVHGVKISDVQTYDFTAYHYHLNNAYVFEGNNLYAQAASANALSLFFIDAGTQQSNCYHCRFLSNSTGDGILITNAINNNFYGGDSEGNKFGARIIQSVASASARTDTNQFNGFDFEANNTALSIGDTANGNYAGAYVIGTRCSSCTFVGANNNIYIDTAQRTNLDGIASGNMIIQTTANATSTYYKRTYGGTSTEGVTLTIANPNEFYDQNLDEGSFLPTVITSNGMYPTAYTTQAGRYVRNGRTVEISGLVYWANSWNIAPTGTLYIQLPITFASTGASLSFENTANHYQLANLQSGGGGFTYTSGMQLTGYVTAGTNYIQVTQSNYNTGSAGVTPPSAAGVLYFSGVFELGNN